MTLEYDKRHNLQNCVRVMWGYSFKGNPEAFVSVYASRSHDQRLYGTMINPKSTFDTGFIEYIAYPVGSDDPKYSINEYEKAIAKDSEASDEAWLSGYRPTEPFYSNDYVFKFDGENSHTLAAGDIMYCYCCIWIEGSDFECKDSAIGGYVKMNINFNAF